MKDLLEGVVVRNRQATETLEIRTRHDERRNEVLILGSSGAFGDNFRGRNFKCADDFGDVRIRAEYAPEHENTNALCHFELLLEGCRVRAHELDILVSDRS
jgi:hypothetical protein